MDKFSLSWRKQIRINPILQFINNRSKLSLSADYHAVPTKSQSNIFPNNYPAFFPTIVEFAYSIQQLIIVITKNFKAPEIHIFFSYYSYVKIFPLIIYISGYINKKLFWIMASVPIACFFFSVIWFFILSEPLYYSHLLDNTFTN